MHSEPTRLEVTPLLATDRSIEEPEADSQPAVNSEEDWSWSPEVYEIACYHHSVQIVPSNGFEKPSRASGPRRHDAGPGPDLNTSSTVPLILSKLGHIKASYSLVWCT